MIINQDDITALCRQCSTDDDAVNNMIQEAETLDIVPFIGVALYNAITAAPSDFKGLLEGCTFQDEKGNLKSHQGLKKALAYYSASRIIRSSNGVMTKYGYVVKYNESSTPADAQRLSNDSNYLREVANQMFEQTKVYIKAVANTEMYSGLVTDSYSEDNGFLKCDLIGD